VGRGRRSRIRIGDRPPLDPRAIATARQEQEADDGDKRGDNLNAAAAAFDKAYDHYVASGKTDVNAQLLLIDRAQIDEKGLTGRPWYQNLIYAPGLYSGYGVKTLPQVREDIELKQWSDVDAAIARTASVIEREVDQLTKATKILDGK